MRGKIFFFLCGLLSMAAPALSQVNFSFTGKITEKGSGQPLAGASVYFSDLKKGAATNNAGEFQVSNLPAGNWLVEVSHLGYSTVVETVNLNGDVKKDYALNTSVIENEGVTVTGVSTATSIKRTPIPVNILRKEDLFRHNSTNLVDNIARTPGVSQVSTGPAVSKPFIRGLGYNRVIIINDGIRHEAQQWGDEHGVEIDELSANKVEILKGPASLMYGSDALAGVINIISVQPPPESTIRGNLLAGYQTNNRQRNFHGDLGGNKNGFSWGFYGSYKGAADYRNRYDGYVFNSKFNERNFGAYLGINKGWGFSHLVISNFNQRFGLVEGERDDATGKFLKRVNVNGTEQEEIASGSDFTSIDPFIPRQQLKHFKIISDNSIKLGKNRVVLMAAYQKDRRLESGDILEPQLKTLYFDLDIINYNLQYHILEKKNWKTTIGANGMFQHNKNRGEETLIPAYNLFDVGIFLYAQKRVDELTLSGGIRMDNRSLHTRQLMEGGIIKFEEFKKDFANLSASLGLAWQAGKHLTLKFNTARGYRAPSIPELASNGAHEGTNRFEYGEKQLKSEISWQTDAGLEVGSEHLSLELSLFYNAIQDFIYYRKLEAVGGGDSIIYDGSDAFFAFRFAQQNARLYGAEFNLDIHPHPLDWLHIENTFSWVKGILNQSQDGSRNLPNIPAARLINELKVDLLKKGKRFRNIFLSAELENTFSQNHPFTGFNTETATKGYSFLHLGLGGDIRNKDRTLLTFLVTANNLTDVAYQNHLSRLKYAPENLVTGRMGVFNMGRNFSIKVNIPLEFKSDPK